MTPAALEWVARFRRYLASERRLSAHTDSSYARDLAALVKFCDRAGLERLGEPRHAARARLRRPLARRRTWPRAASSAACRRCAASTSSCCASAAPPRAAASASGATPRTTCARPRRAPAAADPGRGPDGAPAARFPAAMRSRRATARSWSCCTPRACGWPSWSDLICRHLDLKDRTVQVLGKGKKSRIVPVGRAAVQALQRVAQASARAGAAGGGGAVRRPQRPAPRGACRAAARGRLGAPPGAHACTCTRTCSATPSPRICLNRAANCAACRSCWATPTSPPPRSTLTLTSSTWPASTTLPTRAHAARPEPALTAIAAPIRS